MPATDEQIERMRQLTYTVRFDGDSKALIAVLSELATLRELRDACDAAVKRDGSTPLVIKNALAKCNK